MSNLNANPPNDVAITPVPYSRTSMYIPNKAGVYIH